MGKKIDFDKIIKERGLSKPKSMRRFTKGIKRRLVELRGERNV